MKPFFILLAVFILAIMGTRLFYGTSRVALSGRIALSVMLVFTAMGHFIYAEGMQLMIPLWIPFKEMVVFLTGLMELVAAVGLLLPRWQKTTTWLLILFFILVLPANIQAAVRHLDYEKGTPDGPGLAYLWFRVPLQGFFIAWAWWFGIRSTAGPRPYKRNPANTAPFTINKAFRKRQNFY